jgi:plastocyanin
MSLFRSSRALFVLLLLLVGVAPAASVAQDTSGAPIVVAGGLTNPRGMTWGSDGTMYVALAGGGGPNAATEEIPAAAVIGPFSGGTTAAIAMIGTDGCPVAVATGLPSVVGGMGDVLGAEDVAILGDQLYASVDGGGAGHGNADLPSGVYRILADGTFELVADLSAWSRENPVAELPGADFDPDAAGYSIVADETAGLLWVSDPNSGQIMSVTPDGVIARIADLSAGHPVPTQMVADPEGGVYVGTLTAVPFPDRAASVWHVAADGTVTEVWTGLTTVVGVAVDADGTLYALEMSTGNIQEPPFLQPGSGRLVMQTGPDSLEVVADGLMFPIGLDVGPDGAFYVSMPAIGANDGSGTIVRIGGDAAMATPAVDATSCEPIAETLFAPPAAGSPEAAASESDGDTTSTGSEVAIESFTFSPETVEITAGTTVTWTNNDEAMHTATADDGSFDTGAINQGETASVTFDEPGTYTYVCSFHPGMKGTIIVT